MGYDISYHPISKAQISSWYFEVLQDPARAQATAESHDIDPFYIEKYLNTLASFNETTQV